MTAQFGVTFDLWCAAASWRLCDLTGRVLADAPVTERELRIWFEYGVPAQIVGQALSTKVTPVRVTFTRFFTDDPARVIGRVAV